MRQNDPTFGPVLKPADLADVLELQTEDLDPALPIQTVSTGNPFCMVPLRSLDTAEGITVPQTERVERYLQEHNARFFYFVTRAKAHSGVQWHARMMFYNGEDPATGSAAGPAVAWLVRHGAATSGETVIFEQGVEMRRPSRLYLSARAVGDTVTEVFVGGRTIPVAIGRLFLP
jgi:trans-2,3-dihydro-3-hydroxyanthranilate isomerase